MAEFADARTVRVGEAELAYREVGEGEPVVLVHGDLADLRRWDELLPEIGATRRAIAYGCRYARPNEPVPPGTDNRLEPHVEDLVGLLDEPGAAPAHVVGHSSGGFVALLAAIRRPDLVRTLTLAEPPAVTLFVSMPPKPTELLRLLATRPRTAAAIVGLGAKVISPAEKAFRADEDDEAWMIFATGVLGEEGLAAMPETGRRQAEENVAPLKANILGEGFPPLPDEDVRRVDVPVLLLEGGRTRAVFPRVLDRLEELLSQSERVTLPGASHSLEENPEALRSALLDFLDGGRIAAGPDTMSPT
ncbi:alpha/beta hydrolase [soil metagenome]